MILLAYSNILTAARVEGVQCESVHFSNSQIKAFAKAQVNEFIIIEQFYQTTYLLNTTLLNCSLPKT